MKEKFRKYIAARFMPRWLVLLADITIISVTFLLAYLFRFNLVQLPANVPLMLLHLAMGVPFFILSARLFRPYSGIVRHSSMYDVETLFKAHVVLSAGLVLVSMAGRQFSELLAIPYSVIAVHFLVSFISLVMLRIAVRYVFRRLNTQKGKTAVMIFGAGRMGRIVKNVVVRDGNLNYQVVGYIDDHSGLWRTRIADIPVFSPEAAFGKEMKRRDVKVVIFAVAPASITRERKNEIVDQCMELGIRVLETDDPKKWIKGELNVSHIREVRIEDLLGREPIPSELPVLARAFAGRTVMVTGGAGSIGSEIVRQLVMLQPACIVIADQAESALFEICNEIRPALGNIRLVSYVTDITLKHKMWQIFDLHRPDMVYHAAAYKHVPLLEDDPFMAIYNNVNGTRTIADLACEFGVRKFVMVSTDKAVNPTNVMGASKRIAEMYIQSLSQQQNVATQFITTRFGNVLGSNGSVIPIFRRQIREGGPVTVTHRDIIRYFMTIPEASQLVLEAGCMGGGGEIFLFEMGKPVRIYNLAEKMISLSGFTPHKDIQIVETGLRPGEKLYEELLANEEETMPTSHKKILKARIRTEDYKKARTKIVNMLNQLDELSEFELVAMMKKIVPEYVSNNSRFEKLDRRQEKAEKKARKPVTEER